MKKVDEKLFIKICQESQSMAEACSKLNCMHFNTFKKKALELGCYKPNQSHKGMKINANRQKVSTEEILKGNYPQYETFLLKKRLIKEHIKEDKCELCGWSQKREGEEFTPCELHHKDGNPHNHKLENLIILCPNCHSLTDSYRSKNRARVLKTDDVNAG